jgi:hypothetical protein
LERITCVKFKLTKKNQQLFNSPARDRLTALADGGAVDACPWWVLPSLSSAQKPECRRRAVRTQLQLGDFKMKVALHESPARPSTQKFNYFD